MNRLFSALCLTACALFLSPLHCLATADPIPGIDIIVKKNPGGTAVTVHSAVFDGKSIFYLSGEDVFAMPRLPMAELTRIPDVNGDGQPDYIFDRWGVGASRWLTEYVFQGSAQQATLLQGLLEGLADGSIVPERNSGVPDQNQGVGKINDPIPGIDIVVRKNPPGRSLPQAVKIHRDSTGLPVYIWVAPADFDGDGFGEVDHSPADNGGEDVDKVEQPESPAGEDPTRPQPEKPEELREPRRDEPQPEPAPEDRGDRK